MGTRTLVPGSRGRSVATVGELALGPNPLFWVHEQVRVGVTVARPTRVCCRLVDTRAFLAYEDSAQCAPLFGDYHGTPRVADVCDGCRSRCKLGGMP